jgi:membrane protein DedA with SNARE-associated domain
MPLSETITRLLTSGESSLGVALVGVAAGLKYVFPPFPSDVIVVTSVFLIAREQTALAGAAMAVLFFSAIGFMIQYGVGRVIANSEEHWTTGWRGRVKPRIDVVIERFRRHGSLYVAINRFVPGLRAVMFLGAGMARLEAWKVLVFGTVGAAVWAAVLFAVGYFFGNRWALIQTLLSTYGWYAAVGLVAAIALGVGIRWLFLRLRRSRRRGQ